MEQKQLDMLRLCHERDMRYLERTARAYIIGMACGMVMWAVIIGVIYVIVVSVTNGGV